MDGVLVLFVSLTGNLIKIGQYESTREHRTDKKKKVRSVERTDLSACLSCVCVCVCVVKSDYVCSVHVPFS